MYSDTHRAPATLTTSSLHLAGGLHSRSFDSSSVDVQDATTRAAHALRMRMAQDRSVRLTLGEAVSETMSSSGPLYLQRSIRLFL